MNVSDFNKKYSNYLMHLLIHIIINSHSFDDTMTTIQWCVRYNDDDATTTAIQQQGYNDNDNTMMMIDDDDTPTTEVNMEAYEEVDVKEEEEDEGGRGI